MLANFSTSNTAVFCKHIDSKDHQHNRAERARVVALGQRRRPRPAAVPPPTKAPFAHVKSMDAAGGANEYARAPAADRARSRVGAAAAEEEARMIDANVAVLESHLKKIAARRAMRSSTPSGAAPRSEEFVPSLEDERLSFAEEPSEEVLFPDKVYRDGRDDALRGAGTTTGADAAVVSAEVRGSLRAYVTAIASRYRDMPFHNFAHATHVTAAAHDLLGRMCEVDDDEDVLLVAARTFGMSVDPLARFAIVFASLVHDVDHTGVPNARLVSERDPLAIRYDHRSVAEKRSVAVAWDVLMEDRFRDLRRAIFVDADEMRRFKRLLVRAVLATDIADEDASTRFARRWRTAFDPSEGEERLDWARARPLRATLVLEQIVQASDVAHAMQPWETFVSWNARLYRELARAHREGRGTSSSDPRTNWHEGEVGFFDRYVLPLAERLGECGAFGPAAAGERLARAGENRRRWGEEGPATARAMAIEDDWLAAKVYASSRPTAAGSSRGFFLC